HCLGCHDAKTREGDLDLEHITLDATNADTMATWLAVHDRVRAGEMPPPEKPRPAATARDAFVRELGDKLVTASRDRNARDGRAHARRLSRDEYQNTLVALLGIDRDYRSYLPNDGRALGFDKVGSALSVSAEHVEGFLAASD